MISRFSTHGHDFYYDTFDQDGATVYRMMHSKNPSSEHSYQLKVREELSPLQSRSLLQYMASKCNKSAPATNLDFNVEEEEPQVKIRVGARIVRAGEGGA